MMLNSCKICLWAKMVLHEKQKILVDFNMLIDTDVGSCLYLLKNSSNKDYFKDSVRSWSYLFIKYQVLTRKDENPISILFKEEYQESSHHIYDELKNKKWGEILKVSPLTDITPVILAMATNNEFYEIFINCKNKFEKDKIIKEFKDIFTVIENENNFLKYVSLYIHDLKNISGKKLMGKTVFLYDYALNYFDKDMHTKAINEYAIPYYGTTEFSFISPYKDFILY